MEGRTRIDLAGRSHHQSDQLYPISTSSRQPTPPVHLDNLLFYPIYHLLGQPH
jgi:hypothetical protein